MADEPPIKRMRKGTHSCSECRRRKKSCVPRPGPTPNTCTECFARGSTCREQQPTETAHYGRHRRQNLQQRVAELENALLFLSKRLETTTSPAQGEQSTTQVPHQLQSNRVTSPDNCQSATKVPHHLRCDSSTSTDNCLDNAPVLSLFDNAILSRRQDNSSPDTIEAGITPTTSSIEPAANCRLEKIRQTLLSLLPSRTRLEAILDAAFPWWAHWQHLLPEMFGTGEHYTFDQFIADTKASKSVLKLAKALLCISSGLQDTPLSTKHEASMAIDLTSHYLSVVDDLVLSDDELAGTLEGIECLLLRAKHHSNNGRLPRAWVISRRAISFAQLLGCHLHSTKSEQTNEHVLRRRSIWNALYFGDRYMSLLLGLPYCVSTTLIHPTLSNGIYTIKAETQREVGDDYLFQMAKLVGHIIDRNQTSEPTETLTTTMKIEGEMIDLAASMPNEWWILDIPKDKVLSLLYSRILPQFWHHQTRAILHLPFMLKATTDGRYGYNKIAALESARGMIKIFKLFRPVQGFQALGCKINDFQAFTAAMILVLNFLGVSPSSPPYDVKEADEDRELVSTTTSILQCASLEAGGGVATQAARALEMFIKAKSHGFLAGQGPSKVAIPYFGTVIFGPGKSFANQSRPENPTFQPTIQVPMPEEEPLVSNSGQWSSFVDPAPMTSEINYGGFPLQQPQSIDSGNFFSNVNLDLEEDWSWFWDNTEFPDSDLQSLADLPSLN